MSLSRSIKICPCCGSNEFAITPVLWNSLINEWRLTKYEVEYINRQQGLHCTDCKANMRSMVLAIAIMKSFDYEGLFKNFVKQEHIQKLRILEVNESGSLTIYLSQVLGHTLITYPEADMMCLPFTDMSFDLVVHSDTLEHVKYPIRGLSECFRILNSGGVCAFTIPMIVDRLTISREGLPPSYHGGEDEKSDFLVYTEYGCDAWKHLIQAGFRECRIYSLEYPSTQALVGVKSLYDWESV